TASRCTSWSRCRGRRQPRWRWDGAWNGACAARRAFWWGDPVTTPRSSSTPTARARHWLVSASPCRRQEPTACDSSPHRLGVRNCCPAEIYRSADGGLPSVLAGARTCRDHRLDPAAHIEVAHDLHPAGCARLHEVVQDPVHGALVEDA